MNCEQCGHKISMPEGDEIPICEECANDLFEESL
jgi:ribosome-binding protein aMBF1 (putative translation factor)